MAEKVSLVDEKLADGETLTKSG